MKKTLAAVIFLLIGLATGGVAVRVYMGKAPQRPSETAAAKKAEKKILYYRNPMNPEVTSPVPMKDPMGMDYIPVYEDEAEKLPPGVLRISPEKIQQTGVRSEMAERRTLERVIRTVGRVEPVEDRVHIINAKVSGWIEKLYVNRTDQMVRAGEKLLEIYSPDLVSAQEEYLLALKGIDRVRDSRYPEVKAGAEALLRAARQRLKNWDISDDQIQRIKDTGQVSRTLAISAPDNGSVTEKMVVEGQKIEAGEPLFKVIDHSRVWVYGEIYEYEMPYVKTGQSAALTPSYSPAEVYRGRIEHIYSHLGSIRYAPEEGTEVRTAKVRFELPNKDHRLKLGMYMNVEISVVAASDAVSVPDSAVIDTGERQIIIIDNRDGTFEPREAKIGAKAEDYDEVLAGVSEGEWVVTSANFLLDSESNLKAAIRGMKDGSGVASEGEKKPEQGHAGHSH